MTKATHTTKADLIEVRDPAHHRSFSAKEVGATVETISDSIIGSMPEGQKHKRSRSGGFRQLSAGRGGEGAGPRTNRPDQNRR